ncbi:MAG: hypothetical protein RL226_2246 [Bacteroidota bacterium]|jgi:signal transduction histidine kinase
MYEAEWYQKSEDRFKELLITSAIVATVTYSGGTLLHSLILDRIESFELVYRLLPVATLLIWFLLYKRNKLRAFTFGHVCYQSLFVSNALLGAHVFPDFMLSIILTNIPIILVPALFLTWSGKETLINLVIGLGFWLVWVTLWNFDHPELVRFFTSNLILLPIAAGTYYFSRQRYRSGFQLYVAYAELEKANKDLNEKNDQIALQMTMLDESLKVQDKILSIISHDLKSPLGSLTQLFTIAQQRSDAISKEEFTGLLDAMLLTSSQMANVLDGLLNWTMVRNRKLQIQLEVLDAYAEVADVMTLYTTTAEQKSITLKQTTSDDVAILADRRSLHVIIRNLISNAIKFTPKGGTITIDTEKAGEWVNVTVADTGVGIPPHKLKQLFIHPESTFGTNKERGTGLGLVLVKEIIELNQGKIKVESEINAGSRFIASFPIAHQTRLGTIADN